MSRNNKKNIKKSSDKNKKKTRQQKRNVFYPVSVHTPRYTLTDEHKKKIQRLKIRCKFPNKFGLHKRFSSLKNDYRIANELNQITPTEKQACDAYEKIENTGNSVAKSIKDLKQAIFSINQFEELLFNSGKKISNTLSSKKRENIKILNELKLSLNHFAPNNMVHTQIHLEIISKHTEKLINMLIATKETLPKPKNGQPTNIMKQWLIYWLIDTYETGTKRKAKIWWKDDGGRYCQIKGDYKGKYSGDFYTFIAAAKPIMEKILKTRMGKTTAISKAARLILTKENKSLKKTKEQY